MVQPFTVFARLSFTWQSSPVNVLTFPWPALTHRLQKSNQIYRATEPLQILITYQSNPYFQLQMQQRWKHRTKAPWHRKRRFLWLKNKTKQTLSLVLCGLPSHVPDMVYGKCPPAILCNEKARMEEAREIGYGRYHWVFSALWLLHPRRASSSSSLLCAGLLFKEFQTDKMNRFGVSTTSLSQVEHQMLPLQTPFTPTHLDFLS